MEYQGIKRKVAQYKAVILNTQLYRQIWKDELRDSIMDALTQMNDASGLGGRITTSDRVGNAEAVILAMGKEASGMFARVDEDTNKPLIKDFGSLVYQQLFNGKIQVLVFMPSIEGFGNPAPPAVLGIYRPEELKPAYIERHMEEFVRLLTEWEDFDDDEAKAPIGFHMPQINVPTDRQDGSKE